MSDVPDLPDSQSLIEAFQAWRDGPEPWKRAADLQQLASTSPDSLVDAVLSLWSEGLSDDDLEMLAHGVRAALAASPETAALETRLAQRSHVDRGVAAVVARALAMPSGGVGERHAIEVLGLDLLFGTWSRFQTNRRSDDGQDQQSDVTVDEWAYNIMQGLITFDPEFALEIFLRYLTYEDDPRLRAQAAIDWLESINLDHAPQVIPLIEAEAPTNSRLREAMRNMQPPSDPEIARRFTDAMTEPRERT
jgi:hypothetical protein